MDLLVKKNIIKKNKVIIDIGHKYIKLLGVTYANNRITVTGSYTIDAVPFFFEEELTNYRELVRQINDVINRKKLIRHGEISLSIPSNMVEYRIGSAKNIKISELGKIIKSNVGLNKVNEITHNIDWSYLGQAEKNSDTQTYYLVAAVNKSVLTPLINEFENKNLRVTTVSFSQNNIIGFSEIFGSDFDNPNKLYLDFGMNDTKVIVESSGTAIYSRTIDIGFNTFVDKVFSTCEGVSIPEIIELIRTVGIKKEKYPVAVINEEKYLEVMERINLQWQNEIIRIIRLCENEGVEISKIVCVNTPLLGQLDSFTENDITVDYFPPEEITEFSCAGYSINLDDSEDYSNFGNSIGLAMATMQNDKRLNLLSTEQKEKHINKYLMYGFGGIFAILLLIMLVTYINLGFSNLSLSKLQKEDTKYKQKVSQIKTTEDSLKKNDEFISTYDSLHFPFADLKEELVINLDREDSNFIFGMLQISSICQGDIDKVKEDAIYCNALKIVNSIIHKEAQSIENAIYFYSENLSKTVADYENKIEKYIISKLPKKKAEQIVNLIATGKDDVAQKIITDTINSVGFKWTEQLEKLRKYVDILKCDHNFDIRLFSAEAINVNPSIADKIAYALSFPDFQIQFVMHQILNNNSPVPYDWYLRRNLSISEYERVVKGMGEDYNSVAKEQYNIACSRIMKNACVPVLGIRTRKNLIIELISLLSEGHLESSRIVSFVLIEGLLWQIANEVNKKEHFVLSNDYEFTNLHGNKIQSTRIRDIIKQTAVSKYVDTDFIEHFCEELYAERNPVLHGGDQCHTCPNAGTCLFGKILVLDYIIEKLIELHRYNIFAAWDKMPDERKRRIMSAVLKKE